MSHRVLFASFEHDDDLLAATTAIRRKGLRIIDAFTPDAGPYDQTRVAADSTIWRISSW